MQIERRWATKREDNVENQYAGTTRRGQRIDTAFR
jgi:hypothetical protein